jgi:phage FluMu protein Com
MSDDITITCLKHGDFIQRAGNHIHLKNGCPRCVYEARSSKAEKDIIEFVKKNYDKEILPNERILDGKEIDVYLPELMLGIEYHGCWFHLETVRGKKHHYLKWKIAKSKGIRLIQIYSNEWEEKPEIIKSKIMNLLGKSEKIHARKTKIVELNILKKDEFLTKNHLQGSDGSKICYGLEYNGELVACMTFGASRFNKNFDFELVRFCCKNYSSVIGGASKLLNYFRKRYKGSIVTYADKRHSEGGMYRKIGFTLDGETKPSFMYFNIKNNKLYNRMKFQKKKLKEMPFYDEKLTEYEIMQLNGFDRIWDAGQYRFILSEI